MEVNRELMERHSEQDFIAQLRMYVDSGAGVIHVRAAEQIRALTAIRKQALAEHAEYWEWDVVNGFRSFTLQDLDSHSKEGDGQTNPGDAMEKPLGALRDADQSMNSPTPKYYVYTGMHAYMEQNPHIDQLLTIYSNLLPSTNIVVLLVTPDMALPSKAAESLLSIDFRTPGLGEMSEALDVILEGVEGQFDEIGFTDEDKERICFVGAGMTQAAFDTYAALSIVQAGREGKRELSPDDVIKGVMVGKTDVVNSNDILELYPTSSIDNVGGMENLKDWIRKRSRCYSDEAREFGVEPPKGMVFVGPPGTGKSLAAKAVASVLGIPLVRLDFGRVFNSLVGASEQRMRTALKMVEEMSPVVLFCDEIDKGLGGIGGSSDGGTSNRVLGSFLTWLQDCKHPVFTMVTANNIDGLPPELLRRGRFDAIFSTNLPTPAERRDVLRIHLGLRNRDIEDFPEEEVQEVVSASNEYVPAEIESAVKDALVNAFDAEEELSMRHVKEALATMVPLSRAFKEQIERMASWAKNNATPASMSAEQRAKLSAEVKNRSRISSRIRRSSH